MLVLSESWQPLQACHPYARLYRQCYGHCVFRVCVCVFPFFCLLFGQEDHIKHQHHFFLLLSEASNPVFAEGSGGASLRCASLVCDFLRCLAPFSDSEVIGPEKLKQDFPPEIAIFVYFCKEKRGSSSLHWVIWFLQIRLLQLRRRSMVKTSWATRLYTSLHESVAGLRPALGSGTALRGFHRCAHRDGVMVSVFNVLLGDC